MKYKTLLLLLLVSMTALETHGALFFVRKMNPIQTKTKVDPKIFWLDLKKLGSLSEKGKFLNWIMNMKQRL